MMILGLVKWLQPVHGYDVRRELMSWGVDQWANIQPGSIYHALRKLAEEGLLAEVATEQVGGRPARTTYRVTRAGDQEFQELLRRYWWEYQDPFDPFGAAFSYLPALPRREAVAALRNRVRLLEARIEPMRALLAGEPEWSKYKPAHVTWMAELTVARAEAEIAWCGRIADRIAAGEGWHDSEVDQAEFGRRWRAAIADEFGPGPVEK
ncbi:PadR family transcriptional regulator [Planosporangium mesophilum]|nr:PadR family transcriptional regulator [Planosporangium mesophilum]